MKNTIMILLLSFGLASCSVAPFSSAPTGRTIGPGNFGFEFGNVASSYYIKSTLGVLDNFDFGFIVEFGGYSTSGMYGKYSLLNNTTGPSWSFDVTYGGSEDSAYTSAGTTLSLNIDGALEFYWNPRLVNMSLGITDYDLGTSLGGVSFNSRDITYIYNAVGMNVWFNPDFGINFYVYKITGKDTVNEEPQFGLSFIATM